MLWTMIKTITGMMLDIVIFVLGAVAIALIPFAIMCFIRYIHYYRKGYRFKQREHISTYHRPSFLKHLFFDFPDRFIKDRLTSDPDRFPYTGLVMICGEQGAGKSIGLIHMLMCLKQMYPEVQIFSNISIKFQDGRIEGPEDIIFRNNGFKGCIKVLDEIHAWFNSNESANFPPEMLTEVSQQRKQTSLIIGTAQVFMRISKALREQTSYLILPITVCNCLTIGRVYKIKCDSNGDIVNKRRIKTYFFVQSDEIRESYDTFEKVKRLSMKGWKPRSEQINADTAASSPVVIQTEAVGGKGKK